MNQNTKKTVYLIVLLALWVAAIQVQPFSLSQWLIAGITIPYMLYGFPKLFKSTVV